MVQQVAAVMQSGNVGNLLDMGIDFGAKSQQDAGNSVGRQDSVASLGPTISYRIPYFIILLNFLKL